MADPVTRSAARLAALIAIPVAVLVGVGTFMLLSDAFESSASEPAATSAPATDTPQPTDTTPVEMAARDLPERAAQVCLGLLARAPESLDELPQRPVTGGHEQNAAYGDPAVRLACGVAEVDYDPTDTVYPLNGVCWHAQERDGYSRWTTLDREVPVEVTVPDAYDGPAQRVMGFVGPILETVPSVDEAPHGCG